MGVTKESTSELPRGLNVLICAKHLELCLEVKMSCYYVYLYRVILFNNFIAPPPPLSKWKLWSFKRLSNLPRITQLIRNRVRIRTQDYFTQSLCNLYYPMFVYVLITLSIKLNLKFLSIYFYYTRLRCWPQLLLNMSCPVLSGWVDRIPKNQ